MDKFEDLVKRVIEINKSNGKKWPVAWQLAWLVEEIGELSRELLKLSKVEGRFNPDKQEFDKNSLMEELGDVMYGMVSLAHNVEIDLLEALNYSITKFENRAKNVL